LPRRGDQKGTQYRTEAPIHVANVSLIDPVDDRPCRTRWAYTEGGEKVRQSVRSGQIIPKNKEQLWPGKDIQEGPFDTKPDDVAKQTFQETEMIPKLNWNHD